MGRESATALVAQEDDARLDDLLDLVSHGRLRPRAHLRRPDTERSLVLGALRLHERSGTRLLAEAPRAARNSPRVLLSVTLLRTLLSTAARRNLGGLSLPERGVLSHAVREIGREYEEGNPVALRLATFAAIDLFAQRTVDDPSGALLLAYRFSLERDLRHCWPRRAPPASAIGEFRTLEHAIARGQKNLAAQSILDLFALLFPDLAPPSTSLQREGRP